MSPPPHKLNQLVFGGGFFELLLLIKKRFTGNYISQESFINNVIPFIIIWLMTLTVHSADTLESLAQIAEDRNLHTPDYLDYFEKKEWVSLESIFDLSVVPEEIANFPAFHDKSTTELYEEVYDMYSKGTVGIEIPKKVETVEEALDIYYRYNLNQQRLFEEQIATGKGKETVATRFVLSRALGTEKLLRILEDYSPREVYDTTVQVITTATQLLCILDSDSVTQEVVEGRTSALFMGDFVELGNENPQMADYVLDLVKILKPKSKEYDQSFSTLRSGVMSEIISAHVIRNLDTPANTQFVLKKASADDDSRNGVDFILENVDKGNQPILIEVKKAAPSQVDEGCCTVVPNINRDGGRYSTFRSGREEDWLSTQFGISENFIRTCIKRNSPGLVIRVPRNSAENLTCSDLSNTQDEGYNTLRMEVGSELGGISRKVEGSL